ncbi:VOC family protein [Dactylosporangium sucinum]|nr:VOC family protein [Dactylosporangium sucinum]
MHADDLVARVRLTVDDAASAMTFYREVFDAIELRRECLVDGQIVGAELVVGRHRLVISAWDSDLTSTGWGEEFPADATDPVLRLECAESAAVLRRAVAAGARVVPPADDTHAVIIRDPVGQRWTLVDGV